MTSNTPTLHPDHTTPKPPVISPVESLASLDRATERMAHVLVDLQLDHDAGPLDLSEQLRAVIAALATMALARLAVECLILAGELPERVTVAEALQLREPPV